MVEVKVKERASEARWASVVYFIIILLYLMRFDFRSSQRVPPSPNTPLRRVLTFTTTPTLIP